MSGGRMELMRKQHCHPYCPFFINQDIESCCAILSSINTLKLVIIKHLVKLVDDRLAVPCELRYPFYMIDESDVSIVLIDNARNGALLFDPEFR